MSDHALNDMDFGDDLETARTNFDACLAEVHHCQQQLDQAHQALVSAAEQYGCALARNEPPVGQVLTKPQEGDA